MGSKEKIKIPLKKGKMKTSELAQWFDITTGSYNNKRAEKLEELKMYAEFEEVYGGVIINKIYGDLYYNKEVSRSKQFIREIFDEEWSETGLDTCRNVSDKIFDKYGNELAIVEGTIYNYTIAARNTLYGRPYIEEGIKGNCAYLWCKKEEDSAGNVVLIPFTEEEQKVKEKLMKQYFSTDVEKELWIAEMVERKEIEKSEAYDLLVNMKNLNSQGFMGFKRALEAELGCSIVKGTRIEKKLLLEEGAWE